MTWGSSRTHGRSCGQADGADAPSRAPGRPAASGAGNGAGAIETPDDPIWDPIEGVTLDQYAAVTFGLLQYGITGIEAVEHFAAEHGVPEGRWPEVQTGWVERMGQHAVVRIRYGHL